MEYLKTFESFSINEEGIIGNTKKFFTGYESGEEKEQSENDFFSALKDAEEKAMQNPDTYVFFKDALMKRAKEDNFRGGIRVQKGGKTNKMYVLYDKKATGFQDLASGAGMAMR